MVDDNEPEPVTALFTPSTSLPSAFGQRIDGQPTNKPSQANKPLQENITALLQSPLGFVLVFFIGFFLMGVLRHLGV